MDLRLGTLVPPAPAARLPAFLETLQSILRDAPERIVCVVLPRAASAAHALSLAGALEQFRSHFDELVAEYAKTQFRDGELVRVIPSQFVYEYAGYFPQRLGHFFRLRVLGRTDGEARACEATDALRLQRTERPAPKGRANSSLGAVELSPLDHLLGIRTLGNASIYKAETLLLGSRVRYEAFLRNVDPPAPVRRVAKESAHDGMCSIFPWGTVAEDGSLRMQDGTDGMPLCSVAGGLERLCLAARRLPSDSAWVIVEGARRLRNVEQVHAIVERQRTLVLADPAEYDDIDALQRAGITVWQPDFSELLHEPMAAEPPAVAADVLRAVAVARDLRLQTVPVREDLLDDAALSLRSADAAIIGDVDASAREAVGTCYSLLLDLSEWYLAPQASDVEGARRRLDAVSERLRAASHFLPPAINVAMDSALSALRQFVDRYERSATPKLALLTDTMDQLQRRGATSAIVVRSVAIAEQLRNYIHPRWPNATVEHPRAVPVDAGYDAVVLGAWPFSDSLNRIVGASSTDDIRLIGYPHEQRWLTGYARRRQAMSQRWRLEGEERAKSLGLPPGPKRAPTVEPSSRDESASLEDLLAAVRLEGALSARRKGGTGDGIPIGEALDARYAGFVGNTYAYLTPTHRIPRLNGLLSGERRARSAVEQVVVDDLQPGDFVLFRYSGDSDVIALIAEQMYGRQYTDARRLAEEWRPVLRRIATDPGVVHKQLRRRGLTQQLSTVLGWLRDPSRIGPQNEADLGIIADAARDRWLLEHSHEVFEAIRAVRGFHTSAGNRLTDILLAELPSKLARMGDGETRVELTFGDVWIVQVEQVSEMLERRSYMDVNRLLWDSASQ